MKKIILSIFLAILLGAILGKITFDKYDQNNIRKVIKLDDNLYMLKYSSYKSYNDMVKGTYEFDRYVYIKKNNGYTVYTAISKTRENIDKINKLYDNKYIVQKVNVSNDEFIQNLDEYEKLLTLANDKETIMVIENQILSCYEKMVVNNE